MIITFHWLKQLIKRLLQVKSNVKSRPPKTPANGKAKGNKTKSSKAAETPKPKTGKTPRTQNSKSRPKRNQKVESGYFKETDASDMDEDFEVPSQTPKRKKSSDSPNVSADQPSTSHTENNTLKKGIMLHLLKQSPVSLDYFSKVIK